MSILHNVKWVGFGQLFRILSQLIAIFYLTRLIDPAEYGLLAMATVVMNLANIFNDLGTASAVIQKQNPTQSFYNYIYKINIITGFSVMVLVILISPIMVTYFDRVELYGIIILLAFSFPISSYSIVHKAILEKAMRFEAVIKIEVFSSFIALIVAITMANMGFGVYSLVAQTIVAILIATVLFTKVSNVKLSVREKLNSEYTKGILSFSGHIFSFNLINYFSRNLDSLLIGRFFSAAILGSYSIAYRIMLFPVQNLTFVISRVFLPHFSKKLENVEENKKDYLKSLKIILSLSAPLMLGLAAVSHDFVSIFFDSKWSLIGGLLVWLAPTAIIQSTLSTTGTVFIAYAKTFWLFVLGCIGAVLMVLAFSFGIFFDIKVLTIFYFIANAINFFPVMYLVGKILNFGFGELIKIVVMSVFPAIIMFCLIKIFYMGFFIDNLHQRFIMAVLLGVFSYPLLYALMNLKDVKGLIVFVRKRLGI